MNECLIRAASMLDSSISRDERKQMLQAAVKRHREDLLAATNGEGIDRHLFGNNILQHFFI